MFSRLPTTTMLIGGYILILSAILTGCHGNEFHPNVTFHLQEGLPNRTLIGSLIKEMDLASRYNQSQLVNLQFDIIKKTDTILELFYLNAASGQLYTNDMIDREKGVCQYSVNCNFDLKIGMFMGGVFQVINVRINITDENDNTPTFQKNQISFDITESAPTGTSRHIDPAQDLDMGQGNSIQSYELLPKNESDFELQIGKTQVGGTDLNLVVKNKLDHERRNFYKFYVLAKDGGKPIRTGTLTINVNIVDENDNKPIFQETEKNLTLGEDTLPNSVIYKLTAIDKDSGNNGRVVYKLKDYQKMEIYNLFAIGETTGELTVIGKLVYESGKIYNVYIEASDKGDNPNVAQALVRVTVEDTGNNPPKITVNFFGQPSSDKEVEISENATVGHVVAYIDVEDQDTGANGEVSCSTYNTYFGLTSTQNAKGYNVIVQHVLDRETQPEHSITISCRDKGTPRFEDTARFKVKLRDVNDNQPRFTKHVYKDIEIYENNPIGMSIIQVTATDNDYGKNGEVRYAMYPSTDTRFKVHPLTGLITANMVFDRETSTHVRFEVIAVDSGSPNPLFSYASVLIDVLDRNDEKPDFVKAFFEFQLRENLPSGTTVGFVSATDNDESESGSLTYSFPSDYKNKSIPFVVLSSGEIKTNQALNREDQSRYDFYVMAKDNGQPPLNSTAHVVVFVQDENDNKPQFIFPNKENYTITIPNTIPSDSIIATLQAYDVDDGENGNIMYFLKAGDNDGIFYLDHATGSLYVKKIRNIMEDKRYNLLIQVTDRGSPVKVEEQNMVIVIKYTNVTTAPQHFEDSDRFVLIAVSVICVTFVLSMGLIAVICLLKRREEDKKKASVLFPVNRVPQTAPNLYDQAPPVTNNNYDNSSLDMNGRNKTKVSFSLDKENPKETFTKMQILEKYTGSMNGSENSLKKNPPDYYDVYEKQKNPNTQVNGNSSKFVQQPGKQSQPPNKHTREESPSETSGETITSQDSGRGSEEDFNGHNETQTFEPLFVPGKDSHPSIYVIRQHSRNGRSDIPGKTNSLDKPLPHRQTSLQDHSQDSLLTTSFNSMWSEPSHHNLKNIGTLPTVPSISAWTGGLFYKDGTLGSHSAHSRDDDECTTTSGSYTINDDDLDIDFPSRPRDLFV